MLFTHFSALVLQVAYPYLHVRQSLTPPYLVDHSVFLHDSQPSVFYFLSSYPTVLL